MIDKRCPLCDRGTSHPWTAVFMIANSIFAIQMGQPYGFLVYAFGLAIATTLEILRPPTAAERWLMGIREKCTNEASSHPPGGEGAG